MICYWPILLKNSLATYVEEFSGVSEDQLSGDR